MELTMRVEGADAVSDAESLKNFIENRGAEGLEEVSMKRSVHKEGEQGLGKLLGDLLLKFTGGDEIIKGVVSLLNKWTEQHDKRIHLPNGVVIPTNKLSATQIMEIVTKIKESN